MKFTRIALSIWPMLGALLGAPASAAGDAKHGKAVFVRCAACHTLETGKNRIGPSLAKVVGRKAGTAAGFAYSPALKAYGKVWDARLLDAFLAAPTKVLPGTRMVMAVADPKDRADLIAYLRTASK